MKRARAKMAAALGHSAGLRSGSGKYLGGILLTEGFFTLMQRMH